jgi:hypothetical protein
MTLPLYAGLHLVYGAIMAFAAERRMRGEGEVLGWPLVVTLLPVALVSAPVGAILARFAGGWFFQGIDVTAFPIEFERFHLGILVTVGALAALCTIIGNFAAIAFLSRESRRVALVPVFLGIGIMCTAALVDPMGILEVRPDTPIFSHPAGLCSLAIPLCLAAAYFFVRARLSTPPAVSI